MKAKLRRPNPYCDLPYPKGLIPCELRQRGSCLFRCWAFAVPELRRPMRELDDILHLSTTLPSGDEDRAQARAKLRVIQYIGKFQALWDGDYPYPGR